MIGEIKMIECQCGGTPKQRGRVVQCGGCEAMARNATHWNELSLARFKFAANAMRAESERLLKKADKLDKRHDELKAEGY